ncbi:MAG: ribosomal-processing cysteine protease Prp, partial [Clostridia bacterium]|nr:ribosomal-processing cysteine protease Prp [Clostridia bacterium]
MIRIVFVEKDGRLNGFSVSGHAGYAPYGSNIVCSAVTSAVQLTVNG